MEHLTFHLRDGEDFIPLMSLLKALNIVYSGAEAGEVITRGMVTRNGQPELRKRAKILSGETVCFDRYKITVL
ncbi:MAG: RNA-binding S4 domain-containing protein [Paludibacteraceae bacterium]|nr:RNA-binding S4 domain-containing protein [Paludibacteraceae bacterium]